MSNSNGTTRDSHEATSSDVAASVLSSSPPPASLQLAARLVQTLQETGSVEELKQTTLAYAATNGINMVSDASKGLLVHAPVTLLPTPIHRGSFELVRDLSPLFNELFDRVSRDETFLLEALKGSAQVDPFLASLVGMLKRLREEGKSMTQKVRLGIYRSDYMIHAEERTTHHDQHATPSSSCTTARCPASPTCSSPNPPTDSPSPCPCISSGTCCCGAWCYCPQQVELNTIAASFGGLSTRVSEMHRYMLQRVCRISKEEVEKQTPENRAIQGIAKAFNTAFQCYKQQFPNAPNPCVLMIVQSGESNAVDQRILEYTLWNEYSIPVVRRTLVEIASTYSLDASGQLQLPLHSSSPSPITAATNMSPVPPSSSSSTSSSPLPSTPICTVAIGYYRAGYTPHDFDLGSEKLNSLAWDAVEVLERSHAIKCPSLAVHLAGTKKIQQVLANEGMVERFISDPKHARLIRSTFAGIYAIDSSDGKQDQKAKIQAIIDEAIANPSAFVLKPQREGGGNNLWANDMVRALKTMSEKERAAYILMRKINPRSAPSALFRRGECVVTPCISELGIYSAHVGDGNQTYESSYCGYLLRTKAVGVDEGGVAAGFSCLSSIVYA